MGKAHEITHLKHCMSRVVETLPHLHGSLSGSDGQSAAIPRSARFPHIPIAMNKMLAISFGGEAAGIRESFWEWLSKEANVNLDGTALIATHQPSDHLGNLVPNEKQKVSYLPWTYGQLLVGVEVMSAFLQNGKVAAGDATYAFLDNETAAEWTLLFWAAARLGPVLVSLEPGTLERAGEVQSLVENLKPAVVVIQGSINARSFDGHDLGPYEIKLSCGAPVDGYLSLGGLVCQADVAVAECRSDLDDTALVMCTSGSTSLPKACPVSVRGLIAQKRQYHSLY